MNSSDDTSDDSDVLMTDFDNEETNKPITANEVKEVIMNIKRNNAGPCDNILLMSTLFTRLIFSLLFIVM